MNHAPHRGGAPARALTALVGAALLLAHAPALVAGANECDVRANHVICNYEGQECVDEDPDADGTWECRCAGSSEGDPAVNTVTACVWDKSCNQQQFRTVCTDVGQTCQRITQQELERTGGSVDWKCMCLNGAFGQAVGKAAACVSKEDAATSDYCRDIRSTVCEDDPICERKESGLCERTRCGVAETERECLALESCSWAYNAGGDIPIAGLPYVAAPAYCYHREPIEDNAVMLTILIFVVTGMIAAVLAVWLYARNTRKNLDEKRRGREVEEYMHAELLNDERNVDPIKAIQNEATEVEEILRRAPPNAAGLDELEKRTKGVDEFGLPLEEDDDARKEREARKKQKEEDFPRKKEDTDKSYAIRKELNHLRFLRAEQLLRGQHQHDTEAKRQQIRQLQLEKHEDECRRQRMDQIDQINESNRVEHDHAIHTSIPAEGHRRRREAALLLEKEAVVKHSKSKDDSAAPDTAAGVEVPPGAPTDTLDTPLPPGPEGGTAVDPTDTDAPPGAKPPPGAPLDPTTPPTAAEPPPQPHPHTAAAQPPPKQQPTFSRRAPPQKLSVVPTPSRTTAPSAGQGRIQARPDPQESLNYNDYYSDLIDRQKKENML